MKNYISINNQKIELTDEQVKQITEAYGKGNITLSEVPVGELVKVGDFEFVVLEQFGKETALILKGLYGADTEFAENNNNYDGSYVDDRCRDFAAELAERIGADNIILHTVDLTSDDGLKDYGTVERRASLITAEMYRKYVEILDKFKPKNWWWLATPFSTKRHDNDIWGKCVSPSGFIYDFRCNNIGSGVRPFCIFASSIFESYEE